MHRPTPCILALLATTTLVALLSSPLSAQQFVNGSFEDWGSTSQCGVNSPPDNWNQFNSATTWGVDEGNFAVCPHTIPAGAHSGGTYARSYAILNGGEGLSQTVSGFVAGQSYTIRLHYAGSNRYGGTGDGYWRVWLDGIGIDSTPIYSSLQTSWTLHETTFTATASSHNIAFRGFRDPASPASASLGIDDVAIVPSASAQPYGLACSVGSALGLSSNSPALGATWTLQGSGIEPISPLAVFWFGDGAMLPALDLAGVGAAGCFAHTNANIGAFTASVSGGAASYAVAVPNATALIAAELFVQMSAASTATAVGFTTSNGLAGTIGG